MSDSKRIGYLGEDFATRVLEKSGFQIIDRNFRTKIGEIDIIAVKKECLHFIEVKTRTQDMYGRPCEAITEEKKNRIRKIAELYLTKINGHWRETSIDVFELTSNLIENCI